METPPPSTYRSIAGSPKSSCSFELNRSTRGDFIAWFEVEKHEALRDLQQMVNRYNDCFQLLKGAVTTVEVLQEENQLLAAENLELQLELDEMERGKMAVIGIKNGSDFDSPGGSGSGSGSGPRSEVLSGSGSGSGSGPGPGPGSGSGSGSGTGSEVMAGSGSGSGSGSGLGSGSDKQKRGGAPKSISIRSREYLAVKQPIPGGTHRLRLPGLPASPALQLHGGQNEAGEVEVEVYNQGTSKTELCNKWGESGWCPYEDRCRFAHGMEELKPVIRHPRYKTQLCRMMGSGGNCPYGHRCHFRHALAANPKP